MPFKEEETCFYVFFLLIKMSQEGEKSEEQAKAMMNMIFCKITRYTGEVLLGLEGGAEGL